MSAERMARYKAACRGDTRKAMRLYRANITLCNSFYSLLSIFEIVLRNKIDAHYTSTLNDTEWLINACQAGGFLDNEQTLKTQDAILIAYKELGPHYAHGKLIASLSFGVWRYFFNKHQFAHGGRTLHQIFPGYPLASANPYKSPADFAQADVYKLLTKVNSLRNRVAHHEPICFGTSLEAISDTYATSPISNNPDTGWLVRHCPCRVVLWLG